MCININLLIRFVHLLKVSIQRIAKQLCRAASRLGCRTSVQRDVQGFTHTSAGVGTSTASVAALAGQSSSRGTQATFEEEEEVEEIGPSQLQDAPSTQPMQPCGHRQHRLRDAYTLGTDALGTDALGKGNVKSR